MSQRHNFTTITETFAAWQNGEISEDDMIEITDRIGGDRTSPGGTARKLREEEQKLRNNTEKYYDHQRRYT